MYALIALNASCGTSDLQEQVVEAKFNVTCDTVLCAIIGEFDVWKQYPGTVFTDRLRKNIRNWVG